MERGEKERDREKTIEQQRRRGSIQTGFERTYTHIEGLTVAGRKGSRGIMSRTFFLRMSTQERRIAAAVGKTKLRERERERERENQS